jgi:hypothetical protein
VDERGKGKTKKKKGVGGLGGISCISISNSKQAFFCSFYESNAHYDYEGGIGIDLFLFLFFKICIS